MKDRAEWGFWPRLQASDLTKGNRVIPDENVSAFRVAITGEPSEVLIPPLFAGI